MEQNNTQNQITETKQNKCGSRAWIAVIWTLSVLLAAAAAAVASGWITWTKAKDKYRGEDGLLLFTVREARDIIREHSFYYDTDETAVTDGALKGIASAMGDNYAQYYTKAEYEELKKQNERVFIGIGILTQINDDGVVEILDVYDNTPAKDAGLLPGDILLEINGVPFEKQTLGEFLANVRAEDGAENTFRIRRNGEEMSFVIVARVVYTPAVSSRMLTDTIGYIHVLSFHGSCVEETKEAMRTLRVAGMKELVLDLRDNLGGNLNDAIDIADLFLPKNHVVTTLRSRSGKVTEFKTKSDGTDIKTVILVNELSASASELLAGAMQDYDAAYLIGTKTYGKGIVQSFYEIESTEGWIKFTTDAYYTPNGVCVQDEGITPDRIVELPDEAEQYSIDRIPHELDTQLQAAIEYLEGE